MPDLEGIAATRALLRHPPTVKKRITRILQVLEVTDRTQAALWAQEHGRVPR